MTVSVNPQLKAVPEVGNSGRDPYEKRRTGFTFRGKQILLTKTPGRPWNNLAKKGIKKGIYPESKRIEVVTLYSVTGNPKAVAEMSSVPLYLINKWRKEPWFLDLLKEIRQENNDKIDAKFTEIIEKTLVEVKDRLDNGESVLDGRGNMIKRPVSLRDLGYIMSTHTDKRQIIRGEPTSKTEVSQTIPEKQIDRLEKLAKTFEDLAKYGRKPRTYENAVSEPASKTFLTHETSENSRSSEGGTPENSETVGEGISCSEETSGEKEKE